MAEAFLNEIAGDRFHAESAGIEPGNLNPIVVEAMGEAGLDIAAKRTKSVASMIEGGRQFQHVITVCDETSAERCPVFPGEARRHHWSFADPSSFTGTPAERLAATRVVRDQIRERVRRWSEGGDEST